MKNLKLAAVELNKVMGLQPEIATKVGTTKVDLTENLLKAAAFIQPEDEISKETITTLKEIGWSGPEKAEKKEKKAKKDKKEELVAEVETKEPVAEVKTKKEKKGKKSKKEEPVAEVKTKKEKKGKKGKKEEPVAEAKELKKGPSQTDVLRSLLKKDLTRKKVIKGYMEAFDVSEKKAETRLKLYESHYGDMGENDKKLK